MDPKLARGGRGPFTIAEVRQNDRWYILDNNQKVHFEHLKMHVFELRANRLDSPGKRRRKVCASRRRRGPKGEILLSEGAEPYAVEKLLPPVLEENLELYVEDKSPIATRQMRRVLECKPRATYTQYEADSLDFFEDWSIGER